MLLPEVKLSTRKNQLWTESGLDCLELCLDKEHYKNYPYPVEYKYNSRGFRDAEWPDSMIELQNSTWCIGDSFTVGIGSPLSNTWVNILQTKTNHRCINVSMDGASNKWIARKAIEVLNVIKPKNMIIQWSYLTRDESTDVTKDDEDRRLPDINLSLTELYLINYKLIKATELQKNNCNIIHSFIPQATCLDSKHILAIWNEIKRDSWPDLPKNLMEFNCLSKNIMTELNDFDVYKLFISYYQLIDCITYIPEILQIDRARDGHHYDIITSTKFVDQLVDLIVDFRLS